MAMFCRASLQHLLRATLHLTHPFHYARLGGPWLRDVPQTPVEAVIALSIVFVAAEIVRGWHDREGIAAQAPWIVAFTFGLLHGFGFAGALSEIGLPQGYIPLALLSFNVGVEAGQLLFIGGILSVTAIARKLEIRFPPWLARVPPYAIGSVAMFWVIQRIAAF